MERPTSTGKMYQEATMSWLWWNFLVNLALSSMRQENSITKKIQRQTELYSQSQYEDNKATRTPSYQWLGRSSVIEHLLSVYKTLSLPFSATEERHRARCSDYSFLLDV